MMSLSRCLTVFAVGVLLLAQTSLAQDRAPQYRAVVGQPYSDFRLPNIETGKPTTLSQFRGQKVLLIHFASW